MKLYVHGLGCPAHAPTGTGASPAACICPRLQDATLSVSVYACCWTSADGSCIDRSWRAAECAAQTQVLWPETWCACMQVYSDAALEVVADGSAARAGPVSPAGWDTESQPQPLAAAEAGGMFLALDDPLFLQIASVPSPLSHACTAPPTRACAPTVHAAHACRMRWG
jgi:hypothetical protein